MCATIKKLGALLKGPRKSRRSKNQGYQNHNGVEAQHDSRQNADKLVMGFQVAKRRGHTFLAAIA
jgi:hypothetical protein